MFVLILVLNVFSLLKAVVIYLVSDANLDQNLDNY